MAADTGHKANVAREVDMGEPLVFQKQVKTVGSMYPGRLVGKDTYDNAMKVLKSESALALASASWNSLSFFSASTLAAVSAFVFSWKALSSS